MNIEASEIKLDETIRKLGKYKIEINLGGIKVNIKLNIEKID